jgi:hypothetical protein
VKWDKVGYIGLHEMVILSVLAHDAGFLRSIQ